MTRNSATFRWSIIIIFILSCLIAVLFLDLKSQALGFHNRDYSFYLQFAAKLFDPDLPRRFTLNPDGFNYLGYAGTEGAAGFQQSIHLEPIRYFFAAAFAVTRKPISLFVFYAALYFLLVVYIAYVYPIKHLYDKWFLLLFVLLYVFFPLSLSAISDDLRPRTLIVPAFMLTFLSIHWQRNWVEKLTFFGLLLITPEEAVILAAGLIPYDIIRAHSFGRKNISTILFIGLWLAWLWIQFRYFFWTGYSISQDLTLFQVFQKVLDQWIWIVLVAGCMAILALVYHLKVRKLLIRPETLSIWIFVFLVMPPLIIQMFREEAHWIQSASYLSGFASLIEDLFFLPKNVLLFAASLLLLLQIWEVLPTNKIRKPVLSVMGVVLLVGALVGVNSAFKNVWEFKAAIPPAKILVDLRTTSDKMTTSILTDYAANQAFYDYENLYVFERLPYDILPGEDRFYPANLPVLKDLIRSEVEWVAIGTQSKAQVLQLLKEVQIEHQIIAENNQFIVMRLR